MYHMTEKITKKRAWKQFQKEAQEKRKWDEMVVEIGQLGRESSD
jgi:hypothetical protein